MESFTFALSRAHLGPFPALAVCAWLSAGVRQVGKPQQLEQRRPGQRMTSCRPRRGSVVLFACKSL